MIPQGFDKVKGVFDSKQSLDNEKRVLIGYLKVMQMVGGYNQFMDLPISAYNPLIKGISEMERLQAEKEKSMFGNKKGKN